MTETKKYSMEGYSFKEWAKHNKEGLKALVLFLAGYTYFTGFSWETFVIGLVAIVGKLGVDSIDYWLKE